MERLVWEKENKQCDYSKYYTYYNYFIHLNLKKRDLTGPVEIKQTSVA
jgi:hypothetical protein